jgi:GDPmannose 4,6-dehydratase
VRVDESLVRGKAELHDLVGDASKARRDLGWSPTVDFEELVRMLVDADLAQLQSGHELADSTLSDR